MKKSLETLSHDYLFSSFEKELSVSEKNNWFRKNFPTVPDHYRKSYSVKTSLNEVTITGGSIAVHLTRGNPLVIRPTTIITRSNDPAYMYKGCGKDGSLVFFRRMLECLEQKHQIPISIEKELHSIFTTISIALHEKTAESFLQHLGYPDEEFFGMEESVRKMIFNFLQKNTKIDKKDFPVDDVLRSVSTQKPGKKTFLERIKDTLTGDIFRLPHEPQKK